MSLSEPFQDEFNKILSQQLTHDRSYISWSKSLPSDKILDKSKLKIITDEKIYVNQKLTFVFLKIGYQHFLLFPQCFQKAYSSGS